MAAPLRSETDPPDVGRVRLLDAHTVNQIAAGEVVERPASVVKELVENALDAGARRIEVDLKDSGRALIQVRDDGVGMCRSDMVASLQRHATSKIGRVEDLGALATLGFRGEALPSIASVSRMTLRSATEDGLSWSLAVEGGAQAEPESGASPRGTEVCVEDLFFNTPARLKFLKSDATELAACVDIVQKLAVAYPQVAFRMRHGSTEMFRTTGDGDVLGALAAVWGRDAVRALAPVDHFESGARVRGFISPPHFTKGNRQFQWFFVNGRAVRTRSLQTALDLAYKMLTPERRHPLALVMVDIDSARVDANVSPTKMEVRFQQESAVADAVRHGIKRALLEQGMLPDAAEILRANEAMRGSGAGMLVPDPTAYAKYSTTDPMPLYGNGPPVFDPARSGDLVHPADPVAQAVAALFGASALGTGAPRETLVPDAGAGFGDVGGAGACGGSAVGGAGELGGVDAGSPNAYSSLLDGLRVIGQAASMYILAENRQGLLIVDQHVAHERILFEMLRNSRGETRLERQPLLVPETLPLDRRTFELVQERLGELDSLGFAVEPFGSDTLLVRSAPAALRRRNPVAVLRELIEELVSGGRADATLSARENLWVMCSCKMAVKAGDPLSIPEMEKLLWDLAQTENPYLCPHGRPITMVLRHEDLLRKFKRH